MTNQGHLVFQCKRTICTRWPLFFQGKEKFSRMNEKTPFFALFNRKTGNYLTCLGLKFGRGFLGKRSPESYGKLGLK